MEKFSWILIEPGKNYPAGVTMSEKAAVIMAQNFPAVRKVALAAAKSWRKWRGRTFHKAVSIMSDRRRGRQNAYEIKERITPGAYTVLKVVEPGKGYDCVAD